MTLVSSRAMGAEKWGQQREFREAQACVAQEQVI